MRNVRRKDREILREEALAVVDKCVYSTMATVNPDGTPYCVPLSMVREGEWLYFHSALEGHKIDNLRHMSRVCVSCVGDVKPYPGAFSLVYESAIINGDASEVKDPIEKLHALKLISLRHAPNEMPGFDEYLASAIDRTIVWKVNIVEISGKARRAGK